MTFEQVAAHCLADRNFREGFNRPTGCNVRLRVARSPIEAMVDAATDAPPVIATKDELAAFFAFVYEVVWMRLPR